MHEHDRDLIAALATGDVAGPDAERAEAAISRCPECQGELAAQRRALAFLRSAPPARLTDLEAARLRRRVLGEAGVSPARRRRGPFPWTAAVVATAAVLAGLVMLGPLGGILGGRPAGAPDTAPAAQTEAAEEPAADLDTMAAEEESARTAPLEARSLQPRSLGDLGALDEAALRALLEDPLFEAAAGFTRSDVPSLREVVEDSPLADLPCFAEGYALSDRNLVALLGGRGTFEGEEAVVLAYASASRADDGAPLDERVLWVLEVTECRILHSQTAD